MNCVEVVTDGTAFELNFFDTRSAARPLGPPALAGFAGHFYKAF